MGGVPESIVQFVTRTRENVILDDAAANSTFSADTYIHQCHARSILCLPLINQAKLIGVLYLENNLTSHVFTPKRIAVLKLLVSHASIVAREGLHAANAFPHAASRRRLGGHGVY